MDEKRPSTSGDHLQLELIKKNGNTIRENGSSENLENTWITDDEFDNRSLLTD